MSDTYLQAAPSAPETFWEKASTTRWGTYITDVESRFIQYAHEMSGQPTKAIEIGADSGRWSKMLTDLGWQMTCTDINSETLAICQSRIPNATCICVDSESQEFPCGCESARLLLAIEVHELVEQDWFIEETDRVLEPGGMLVCVFQNTASWRAVVRNRMADSKVHYTAAYSPWRKKLKRHGFKVIKEEGLCWMPFGRMSDSKLIPVAVELERLIGLRKLVSLSPWIVILAQKSTEKSESQDSTNRKKKWKKSRPTTR